MADEERAKRVRAAAKGRLTRTTNHLTSHINDGGREGALLNACFSDVEKACRNLEEKHDSYMAVVADPEDAAHEGWMTECQDSYYDARKLYHARKKNIEENEQLERMVVSRDAKYKSFLDSVRTVEESIKRKRAVESVQREMMSLSRQFDEIKETYAIISSMKPDDKVMLDWIQEASDRYSSIMDQLEIYVQSVVEKSFSKSLSESRKEGRPKLELQKMPLPKFDGDVRRYARFKSDFVELVKPLLARKQASFALRQCLTPEIGKLVESCEDDLDSMFERLDEKFGDPSKLVDVIVAKIIKFRQIESNEDKKLIEFIEAIEAGYRDLKSMNLEKEMSNANVVSIIENKLPRSLALEWFREIHKEKSEIDKTEKFPHLLKFLSVERKSLEYGMSELRLTAYDKTAKVHVANYGGEVSNKCLIHGDGSHKTVDCKRYLSMDLNEKYGVIREKSACFSCLDVGHFAVDCKNKEGCVEGCDKLHHKSLHLDEKITKINNFASNKHSDAQSCVLQIMDVKVAAGRNRSVNVLWDGGSTVSLVTNQKANLYGLRGKPVKLSLTTCGGEEREIDSYRYTVPLLAQDGRKFNINAYGIDKITSDISKVNVSNVIHLFKGLSIKDLQRPTGTVDLLIGLEYAAWHPRSVQENGHLLVLENQFGRCIGGSHQSLEEGTMKSILQVTVNNVSLSKFLEIESMGIETTPLCANCIGGSHQSLEEGTMKSILQVTVNNVSLSKFLEIESMGIETTPLCGNCRCGECPVGGKRYTIKEERELEMIRKNLVFKGDHWEVTYPWTRSPRDLPNNKEFALRRLLQTEKRLAKDNEWSEIYCQQMEDMVSRGIARKLTEDEIRGYEGPVHYIAHHAVINNGSKTTPVRIVFNSSANFKGHSLNNYWAKGPNAFMNPLLGVLLRFREEYCVMVADIRKMYNSVSISLLDQHCHRYLWREMRLDRDPETYAITAVNLGDKPGGTIATVALRETAEMYRGEYPEAAERITKSTYVDDIIDSVSHPQVAISLAQEISFVLKKGNFHIKGWQLSGGLPLDGDGNPVKTDDLTLVNIGPAETEKVLGMRWEPDRDSFRFVVKDGVPIDTNQKRKWTKRSLISFVNGIYDPMGLITPVISRGKIIIRKTWAHEPKLDWDDPLPDDISHSCSNFTADMVHLKEITFERCVRPKDVVGNPILVTFSDASEEVFGACCYLQWKTTQGFHVCKLILAKSRAAPLKVMTIVRLELSAAVLAVRMRRYITKEGRIPIDGVTHIVDSEIVRTMIQKESYGFNTFVATRVGEIQENSDPGEWYWIDGKMNISDLITRGASPSEIGEGTTWQNGPPFSHLGIHEWPITQACYTKDLPERKHICLSAVVKEEVQPIIDINRFSKYLRLIYCTARILAINQSGRFSLRNVGKDVSSEKFKEAVQFWIMEAQRQINVGMIKALKGKGKFRKLCPLRREDGVFVIGERACRWTEISYNKEMLPILPKNHRFSKLFARYIHEKAHLGVDADVAKIRGEFWILGITEIVKSIRHRCVTCRRKYMKLLEQRMGRLPIERLKPAPPWYHAMIDLFGPFIVRGEVNKRASMKVYGVIISDLLTRAVHVDIASDYSTDAFLMVFRKFVSIRGYPSVFFSDNGSQLVGASTELKTITESWDWKEVAAFGVSEGLEWRFSPSDSPWWNGCVESLVRSVKKAMCHAVGEQRLSFGELQTVCFEAANIVNERPIGVKPNASSETTYLSPNDMLLGRSTIKVPNDSFDKGSNLSKRYRFVQAIAESYWKKWTSSYFPNLLVQQKWHHTRRNVKVGDIVVISDKSLSRNKWKIGMVREAVAGSDGAVRRIKIRYKNPEMDAFTEIERAVQRVNVILPVDEPAE